MTYFGLIIFILCFLCNWYGDLIAGYLTEFTLFAIKLMLLIMLIIFLFITVKNINKNKRKNSIFFVILLISSVFSLFYNFRLLKAKVEINLYDKQRNIIIEKVKNNELTYYFDKNIKLPIYQYVSSDGEIYVYKNEDEQVIGFWIFRGILSGSAELIYSSDGEDLIYDIKKTSEIIKIIKLKENWYYVESNY